MTYLKKWLSIELRAGISERLTSYIESVHKMMPVDA
jgi:hypothetical protein